jgi:quercetin dioxygenase-like cupin family protein
MLRTEVTPVPDVQTSPIELLQGFAEVEALPTIRPVEGIEIRAVSGRDLTLSFVFFAAGAVAPMHTHPQEQMGTVLEGEMELDINGDRRVLHPGEVYSIPPGLPHGARAVGDKPSVALDVFTPRREDFAALASGISAR